jgi:CheY-like chemotaxis protein
LNVLFVTDDTSYRLAVANFLRHEGYDLAFAKNAREGMELLKKGPMDIVISDLEMPGIDGPEFCGTVRKHPSNKNLPFIFLYKYIENEAALKVSLIKDCALFRKGSSVGEMIDLVRLLTSLEEEGTPATPAQAGEAAMPEAAPEPLPEPENTQGSQEPQRHYNARILLVDDEDTFRLLLGDILTDNGYKDVSMATDGSEAIEMLKKEHFDLLLLDIVMPNVSGFGVLHFIHDHVPATKVIMLTAYADLKLGVEAKKLGAVDFIAKPIMQKDFFATLEKALSGRSS